MTSIVFFRAARIRSKHGVTLVLLCFTELIVAWVGSTYVWGGAIGARPYKGRACMFWGFQISTLASRNRLPHL